MSQRLEFARCWFAALATAGLASSLIGCGSSYNGPSMIVLGFDGMDYALTTRLMAEGKMPSFVRLAESGSFGQLQTVPPPQSPVAWSTFITGLDSGGHGIFDFIHRDPNHSVQVGERSLRLQPGSPYLSTSAALPPGLTLTFGRWQFPLTGGGIELLRRGQPFWELLEEAGVETTIVRMPANFPPSGTATRELSGMGTPDITGSPGIFTLYTTNRSLFLKGSVSGGQIFPADIVDGVFEGALFGPPHPLLVPEKTSTAADPLQAKFSVYIDPVDSVARFVVGESEFILREGEWSNWVNTEFEVIPWLMAISGSARFYLKSLKPDFELYISPVQVDPLAPAMPISTPDSYAVELAEATGRYYTQEMPEDSQALRNKVFDNADFMAQANIAGQEFIRQYDHVLAQFKRGFLFYYFGNLDQVSHMMWRAFDPDHPAHDAVTDPPYAREIEKRYIEMDRVLGHTIDHALPGTIIVAMSDHGFTSWRRSFHLNTWLVENDYLKLKDPNARRNGPTDFFTGVDWSRTQAYALGLTGLYVNLRGREPQGSVAPGDRTELLSQLERDLLATVDPESGMLAVTNIYIRERDFDNGDYLEIGPDIVVGYARGVRQADNTALGGIGEVFIEDNTGMWSGDHIMDHRTVPGILLTSEPLRVPATSLKNLAAALLEEFEITGFPRPNEDLE